MTQEKLQSESAINGRNAFLGQEELSYSTFMDAAGLLDLDLTTGQVYDPARIRQALDERTGEPTFNVEHHVAAVQIVKMWAGLLEVENASR